MNLDIQVPELTQEKKCPRFKIYSIYTIHVLQPNKL
jgi:hypothetical protein